MKILILPGHEPIFSELAYRWTDIGHEVNLLMNRHTRQWDEKIAKIPKGVLLNSKEKPDIIYCSSHSKTLMYALTQKVKRLWFDVPIVTTHYWFPDRRALPLYYMVKHTSVSKYAGDYLQSISGIDSRVIYPPVDTDFFKPQKTKHEKTATIIGNNFKQRSGGGKSKDIMGTDHLLNILNLVHEMNPEIKLIVNGYNPDLQVPSFVKKSFFEGNYKIGLHKLIVNSSCLFFTVTRNPSTTHSMLYSLSSGEWLVTWDIPPYHEIMKNGKSASIIENFNEKKFAEKIVEVCNKPKKINNLGRKSVIEKCESKMVAKQFTDFFEEIL
ncbi:MAG: hypothetical protein HYS62_01020 [Candidatus Aenigmarchaeota archaeon]|nr:hypothetical protein [Candidatus Aenigmarchaeota archaeon]